SVAAISEAPAMTMPSPSPVPLSDERIAELQRRLDQHLYMRPEDKQTVRDMIRALRSSPPSTGDVAGWRPDDDAAKAAAKAVAEYEIGPAKDPDEMLTLFDLVPEAWCAPDRKAET